MVCQTNVGYHRSPLLTSAAALVRFWKHQLQARRNRLGLSTRQLKYAQVTDLPQLVPLENEILQHLREVLVALRTVQLQAHKSRSTWLIELANSVAVSQHTTREKALARMVN